jgi:hypothetical protein
MRDLQAFAPTPPKTKSLSPVTAPPDRESPKRFRTAAKCRLAEDHALREILVRT